MTGIKNCDSVLLIKINIAYINTDFDNILFNFLSGMGTTRTTKNIIIKKLKIQ